jgi:hypothetical protein
VYVPPIEKASFRLPGECYFLVVTSIGSEIKWLPEQIAGDGWMNDKWTENEVKRIMTY